MALTSTIRVRSSRAPLGRRLLILSLVSAVTQVLMVCCAARYWVDEVLEVDAGAVALRERVEERLRPGVGLVSPQTEFTTWSW